MDELIMKEVSALFPEQAFLTLEDVARLVGCSKKVVYNWTSELIPRSDLLASPSEKQFDFLKGHSYSGF